MISQLIKLIRIISADVAPIQISLGFALAMIIGLTPFWSVHNILVIFLLLVLRANIAAFMLAWVIFTGMAYVFDPWFNDLGGFILNHPSLNPLWTELYNSAFWRVAHFNNTIVMGSLSVSVLLFIPAMLLSNVLIKKYRTHVVAYIQNSHWAKLIQSKWFDKAVSLAE